MMRWETLQQLIRIAAYTGGSWLFGDSIANGEMYQAAIGGGINIAAFIWWWYHEANKA